MRFGMLFIAAASAAGCGSPEADSAAPAEESEVTLELPPELPPATTLPPPAPPASQATEASSEPGEAPEKEGGAEPKREEPAPAKAEEPPPREEAAPEAPAAEEAGPAGAGPPLADAAIARTIDRIGYRCGNVLSVTRLEETNAAGQPVYRIACSSGETYRGTNRGGRMYFRPWTGRLSGR